MVDRVRDLLTSIEADGTEGDVDVSVVVEQISALLDGRETPAAEPTPVAELVPEAVEPEPAPSSTPS